MTGIDEISETEWISIMKAALTEWRNTKKDTEDLFKSETWEQLIKTSEANRKQYKNLEYVKKISNALVNKILVNPFNGIIYQYLARCRRSDSDKSNEFYVICEKIRMQKTFATENETDDDIQCISQIKFDENQENFNEKPAKKDAENVATKYDYNLRPKRPRFTSVSKSRSKKKPDIRNKVPSPRKRSVTRSSPIRQRRAPIRRAPKKPPQPTIYDIHFSDSDNNSSDSEGESDPSKKFKEIQKKFPKPNDAVDLTPEMLRNIKQTLRKTENEILNPEKSKKLGLYLKRDDFAKFGVEEKLEDINLDFYMELIKLRNNMIGSSYPKVFIFRCSFYKLLSNEGYESVKGATHPENIFNYELGIIPVHIGSDDNGHWILIVMNFKEKTLRCYDSIGGSNAKHLKIVKQYFIREWESQESERKSCTGSGDTNPDCWKLQAVSGLPKQDNGDDCGIFCLQFAEYLSRGKIINFNQEHIPYFRYRMMYEVNTCKILAT